MVHPSNRKSSDGLDVPVARRVVRRLEQAAVEPVRSFTRLVRSDNHKLRIGDFRLLALLSHDTKTILVERVDHIACIAHVADRRSGRAH